MQESTFEERYKPSVEVEQEPRRREFAGAIVNSVIEDSPAAKVGVQQDDIIERVNGLDFTGEFSFLPKITGQSDSPVRLSLLRKGNRLDVTMQPKLDEQTGRYYCGLRYTSHHFVEKTDQGGEEKIFERMTGEYFDNEGDVVCSYVVDVANEKIIYWDGNQERTGRAIDEITLHAKGKSINLLQRFNNRGIPVILSQELLSAGMAGMHEPRSDRIVISEIERPIYIHTLLHELTHADQNNKKEWIPFLKAYGISKFTMDVKNLWDLDLHSNMLKIQRLIPELFEGSDPAPAIKQAEDILAESYDTIGHLKELEQEIRMLTIPPLKDIAELNNQVEILAKDNQEIVAKANAAYSLVEKIEIRPGLTLLGALSYPRWIVERDAERGALVNLRKIRQETGIDFFRPLSLMSRIERETIALADNKDFMGTQPLEIREGLKKDVTVILEKYQGETITPMEAVREYMKKIGATHSAIRKIKKTNAKKTVTV